MTNQVKSLFLALHMECESGSARSGMECESTVYRKYFE